MFSKIVVALNDLPESQRALRAAIDLARSFSAELATVSIVGELPAYSSFSAVVDPGAPATMMEEREHRHLELHQKAADLARELGVHAKGSVLAGKEVRSILRFSKSRRPICSWLHCINTTSICPVFGIPFMTWLRALLAACSECIE
jgi:nucleotide-binding universal stress UspA family protein